MNYPGNFLETTTMKGDADALRIGRVILGELNELAKHTHGMAYPDCPKCAREREIIGLLKGAAPMPDVDEFIDRMQKRGL